MTTTAAYVGRHRATPDDDGTYLAFDPTDPCDAYEVEEVLAVLRAMPLNPDDLGDGSASDWTLSILLYLAGRGDADAAEWVAPRIAAAALTLLSEVGYPGDAFAGA